MICWFEESFLNLDHLGKVDTSDFIEIISNWTRYEWFQKQTAEYNNKEVTFNVVTTMDGQCFNFNMNPEVYKKDL